MDILPFMDCSDQDLLLFMVVGDFEDFDGWRNIRFSLDDYSDEECKNLFRFFKADIHRLYQLFHIPEKVICANGSCTSGVTALVMFLRRLAYPNRLSDLQRVFGRSECELSLFISFVLDHIYDQFGHLVQDMGVPLLQEPYLQLYSDAIGKICPLQNVIGFIDGTVMPICRPTENQREYFSGHKRVHGLKFQSLMLPTGLIGNIFGPVEGRRHDAFMLRQSGLLAQLETLPLAATGIRYALYGDAAYPFRAQLLCPFRGARLTDEQKEFNRRMSSVRECVEWGFGKIVVQWAFLDFKKNQKILLQPVAKYYIVATLLTNCHTCIYGSQTGTYFGLCPPALETYLR